MPLPADFAFDSAILVVGDIDLAPFTRTEGTYLMVRLVEHTRKAYGPVERAWGVHIYGSDDGAYIREFTDEDAARRFVTNLPPFLTQSLVTALGFAWNG